MNNATKITSIADLAKQLNELGLPKDGCSRFFRGHSDCNYQLEPSIYRDRSRKKNEHLIIKDSFISCHQSFQQQSTLFEKLTKLQHYNGATRLLDITSNVLVALYFALAKADKQEVDNPEKDGEIVIFDISHSEIEYEDSEIVALLSSLSLQDEKFNLYECMKESYRSAKFDYDCFIEQDEIDNFEKFKTNEFYLKNQDFFNVFFSKRQKNIKRERFIDSFNQQDAIKTLLLNVKKEIPTFERQITPSELNKVVCVRTKKDNQRIEKQFGDFLLFGVGRNKLTSAKVPTKWIRSEKRFLIAKECKSKLLEELKLFGISHQTLFPELSNQAKFILDSYANNKR